MERDERIKVLIADDDTLFLKKLNDYISEQKDMQVVALARNGEDAVQMMMDEKPDIALIDLIMPLKDGFGVLEDMKSKNIKTSCILISAISLDSTAVKALALGAKYFVIKPYRTEFLAERIRQIYEETRLNMNEISNFSYCDFVPLQNPILEEKEMETPEHRVSQLLNKMGISASVKGYYYLRSAILMVLDDQEAIIGITKRMYPDVAKEYNTTASKVERAIRHAIESAWKRGAGKIYSEIVGIKNEAKPTNGQFIAAIGEYLRLNDGEYRTA